jgi:hypothetical protein
VGELLKLLGLGTPFVAAVAIYTLFNFLDKKASTAANQAIAAWIEGKSYKRLDLREAVIGSFDQLYGVPLFRRKAFLRSASFSLISVIVYFMFVVKLRGPVLGIARGLGVIGAVIIISDYISLFMIRRCLALGRQSLRMSVLLAFASGIAVVGVILILYDIFAWVIVAGIFGGGPIDALVDAFNHPTKFLLTVFESTKYSSTWQFIAPAIFVNLWLPLLLLGAATNAGLNSFFRFTGAARWFLEKGAERPLEAIGMTASVIVFVMVALAQGIGYVL